MLRPAQQRCPQGPERKPNEHPRSKPAVLSCPSSRESRSWNPTLEDHEVWGTG